jgi:hypothetical protein
MEEADNITSRLGLPQNTSKFLNKPVTFLDYARYKYRATPQAVD